MAAPLTLQTLLRVILGGESARFDITRTALSVSNKIVDATFDLPDGQAVGSPTTLWTGPNHADAVTNPLPEQFKCLAVLVDPDTEDSAVLPVDLEVHTTAQGGGTTLVARRIDRNTPLLFATSQTGASLTVISGATPSQITRITARNPAIEAAGASDVKVRIVGFL